MNSALSIKFFLQVVFISLVYLLINISFTNLSLIKDTILGSYSFTYKTNLLLGLIQGLTTAMSTLNLISLILISILTGANFALLLTKIHTLKKAKNFHFLAGGTFLGTATAGCTSCGLPFLGILGLSSSLAFLPFRGLEISFLAIALLIFSFTNLLKKSPTTCRI